MEFDVVVNTGPYELRLSVHVHPILILELLTYLPPPRGRSHRTIAPSTGNGGGGREEGRGKEVRAGKESCGRVIRSVFCWRGLGKEGARAEKTAA